MAITLAELKDHIESLDLRCQAIQEIGAILVGFRLEDECTYRDRDGDPCVPLVFRPAEQGEFLSAFVPGCWFLNDTVHGAAVTEVLLGVQSRLKLVRFDLAEGTIVPNIEVSVEDGTLTVNQVQRIINVLLGAVRKFDVVVRRAIESGDTSLPALEMFDDNDEGATDAEDPSNPPPDGLGRLLDLMEEAGGLDGGAIEALERLLGGDGAPPVET